MRKHLFATSSRSILCTAAILILTCVMVSALVAQRVPKILGRKAYRSPDRTLVATVVSLQQLHTNTTADNPSRVEIRNAGGRLLASRNHSDDAEQGFTVEAAAWTPDSRFFVYSVSNSGGHSPWHNPIFLYSRKRNRFYNLDRALEAMGHGPGTITGGIKLRSPSTLLTRARYRGKSRKGLRVSAEEGLEHDLIIDLRWLEPRLSRAVEDYYR